MPQPGQSSQKMRACLSCTTSLFVPWNVCPLTDNTRSAKIFPSQWNILTMSLLSFQRKRVLEETHRAMLACHDSLFRYARALSRDQAEAEELVQECYRRALSAVRKPPLGEPEEVRRWLFVILKNIWKNDRRARAREDCLDEAGPLEAAPEQSPENTLLRRALQIEVRAALDSLSEAHREIIVLRDMEGLAYEQIARVLECPVGTVMSRLARARTRLREILSEVVGRESRREAHQ
jgi:RNA polymerase sigma-70 factor, ECF subfamily